MSCFTSIKDTIRMRYSRADAPNWMPPSTVVFSVGIKLKKEPILCPTKETPWVNEATTNSTASNGKKIERWEISQIPPFPKPIIYINEVSLRAFYFSLFCVHWFDGWLAGRLKRFQQPLMCWNSFSFIFWVSASYFRGYEFFCLQSCICVLVIETWKLYQFVSTLLKRKWWVYWTQSGLKAQSMSGLLILMIIAKIAARLTFPNNRQIKKCNK